MSAALAALIPAKATNAVVVKMSFFIEVLPLWGRRASPLSFDTLPDDRGKLCDIRATRRPKADEACASRGCLRPAVEKETAALPAG
jgi:hypothetical protein